ncbi:hypothetical protein LYNGBM3L_52510 [Moorena producens 3L]|uniref:Uncharacterized protein n=1 Tax=Moorena producens 3L TaxID=489825 RepID=F4XYZ5_9CYAN|nr:hypothetical protein LYNGBM3L_52510 [Moorena producens 3L]
MQRGHGEAVPSRGGSPHDRTAVVSPTRALHQDNVGIIN